MPILLSNPIHTTLIQTTWPYLSTYILYEAIIQVYSILLFVYYSADSDADKQEHQEKCLEHGDKIDIITM